MQANRLRFPRCAPFRSASGPVVLTLSAAVLFLAGLGRTPLWDDDETRFGSVAREMIRNGDWVVPRYNGELADKPAGLFWAIAAGFLLFGESPGAARFISASCGIAVVLMTWALGKILYGRREAFWAALAVCTSLLVVLEARAATADSALLAVITAMLLTAVRAWWRAGSFRSEKLPSRTALAIGALAGAGILLKGLVAFVVPLLCLFLFAFWAMPSPGQGAPFFRTRVLSAARTIRPFLVLLAAFVVAAPWHIAVGWQTGGEWLGLFYWKHHFVRAVSVLEGHGGVPFLQLPLLFAGLFPWSVFLPLAVWRTWRSAARPDGETSASKLLVSWLGVWLLLFSLTATQLPNYVLPAYPALCLCIGRLVARAIQAPDSMDNAWMYAASAGLVFGGAVIGAGFWCAADWTGLDAVRECARLGLLPLAGAVVFGFGVAFGRRKLAMGTFVFAAVALVVAVFLVEASRLGKVDPVPSLVKRADQLAGGCATLSSFRFTAPGLVWSADRRVKVCVSAEEAAAFLLSSPRRSMVFVAASAYEQLAAAFAGRMEIVAEGQPLTRLGKVLLVRLRWPKTTT